MVLLRSHHASVAFVRVCVFSFAVFFVAQKHSTILFMCDSIIDAIVADGLVGEWERQLDSLKDKPAELFSVKHKIKGLQNELAQKIAADLPPGRDTVRQLMDQQSAFVVGDDTSDIVAWKTRVRTQTILSKIIQLACVRV